MVSIYIICIKFFQQPNAKYLIFFTKNVYDKVKLKRAIIFWLGNVGCLTPRTNRCPIILIKKHSIVGSNFLKTRKKTHTYILETHAHENMSQSTQCGKSGKH